MRYRNAQVLLVLVPLGHGVQAYEWAECKQQVQRIQRGELAIGAINNETLHEYLYNGPFFGLDKSFPTGQYLTVTYEGTAATQVPLSYDN